MTEERAPAPGDRVVLVTGASRGIGAACASWFFEHGDQVAIASRSGAAGSLSGRPGDRLLNLECDVRDPGQVEAAFAKVESQWGPVEVLVANAGITRDTLVLRMSEEDWRDVVETNLTGSWRVAKRAAGRMVRARRGRIILLSSVGAFVGLPGQANYAASKAGLLGMARALAREVASRGITVNVVAPGVVDTDMVAALGESRVQELRAMVPLGRTGQPDDVAAAVGFLASAQAAYITGAVIPVDGGLGMGL
jgi:3-oxoacyl-[acyl-carrier protein] reductase